jgi:hypothetical protein
MRDSALLNDLLELRTLLITEATTGAWGDKEARRRRDERFRALRGDLLEAPSVAGLMPQFLRVCHDIPEFWEFISSKFRSYAERRVFIRNELRLPFEVAEGHTPTPLDAALGSELRSYDEAGVIEAWDRA